ncbi:15595_t:CDS:2 [Funneliformis geosporum]|nr:15595_t:CDS:2 [Funneliformis geosporum]
MSPKLIGAFYSIYYKIFERNFKVKQYITLIVPYMSYSCYPSDYRWTEIFKPQQSVFVNTCKKDFYANWNDSLKTQNLSDSNNPWTISNTFYQTDENGNILNQTLIQTPDEKTNLFFSYPTSLLAMYLFLTGNQDSLSIWTPSENKTLLILMAVFSFLIVIYLMNLFIGLLNMAIEKDNDRASYLALKAEIIAEMELFDLPPRLRRIRTRFPEVIHYRVDVEMSRRYIKEAIKKGDWNMDDWSEMKHKLLKLLNIEDAAKRD